MACVHARWAVEPARLHPIKRPKVGEKSITSTQKLLTGVWPNCPIKALWDRVLLLERPVPQCVQATWKQPLACHFSKALQLDHTACELKTRLLQLCTPRTWPASPRTGAGPDGRAGSTALCSTAWGPPACSHGLMSSTRAYGAGIAAIAAIRLSPSPELRKGKGVRGVRIVTISRSHRSVANQWGQGTRRVTMASDF